MSPARVRRLFNRQGARPRLLLVDDHRGILEHVSALLSTDFEIAGAATDGRQALDLVRTLNPDAIVLDVNMPELNGFQTMRALDRLGSRAPVVFLSMMDTADEISEAFRSGGRGFVVKTRLSDDLPAAIDQVLAGRLFVPSLTSLWRLAGGAAHATQLYGDTASCLDSLEAFFDLALRRGEATCLLAPGDLREGLEQRLVHRGWKVSGPGAHNRYRAIDADQALRRVMRRGMPDAGMLARIAEELNEYRRAEAGDASRLTFWGNMASILIANGHSDAGLAVERHWDEATRGLPILTVCGYPVACFTAAVPDLWSATCAAHGAVTHSNNI